MYIEYREGGSPWRLAQDHHMVDDGSYRYLNQVDAGNGRDYLLFGKLANVRTEGPEPKGIPKGCSEEIRRELESYHSHSWATPEELLAALKACNDDRAPIEHYDLKDTSTEAFYDHDVYRAKYGERYWDELPQSYVPVINYCNALKKDLESMSQILLDDKDAKVEVRIVFGFDS